MPVDIREVDCSEDFDWLAIQAVGTHSHWNVEFRRYFIVVTTADSSKVGHGRTSGEIKRTFQ